METSLCRLGRWQFLFSGFSAHVCLAEPARPGSSLKPRLRWTSELHRRFVAAVEQLGGPLQVRVLVSVVRRITEHVVAGLKGYYLEALRPTDPAQAVPALLIM